MVSYVCAAKDKGEKKLFGFSFTPLMREDGTTLTDDSHELYVYKVLHRGRHLLHFLSDQIPSAVNRETQALLTVILFLLLLLLLLLLFHYTSSAMKTPPSLTPPSTSVFPAARTTSPAVPTSRPAWSSSAAPRRPSGSPLSCLPPSSPRTVSPLVRG